MLYCVPVFSINIIVQHVKSNSRALFFHMIMKFAKYIFFSKKHEVSGNTAPQFKKYKNFLFEFCDACLYTWELGCHKMLYYILSVFNHCKACVKHVERALFYNFKSIQLPKSMKLWQHCSPVQQIPKHFFESPIRPVSFEPGSKTFLNMLLSDFWQT